jgi:hypothetical protein
VPRKCRAGLSHDGDFFWLVGLESLVGWLICWLLAVWLLAAMLAAR